MATHFKSFGDLITGVVLARCFDVVDCSYFAADGQGLFGTDWGGPCFGQPGLGGRVGPEVGPTTAQDDRWSVGAVPSQLLK